ncbi:MAG: hypothetical protein U0163_15450 [Gemmatimonadaceae bacterium]
MTRGSVNDRYRVARLSSVLVIALFATGCGSGDGPAAPTTGSMAVAISGLPSGATAAVTVTGPSGFSQVIAASTTVASLAPGAYTVAADRVMAGDVAYDAESGTQQVTVAASRTATPVAVGYGVHTGTLQLTIGGLPEGTNAAVTVTGPGGFTRLLTGTTTLTVLTPGDYAIAAANAPSGGHTYAPSASSQTVTVAASSTPATASVAYAVSTGAISVTMSGLPSGTNGSAQLTGPDGYHHTIAGAETVTNLHPGTYTVTGSSVTAGADHYAPTGAPTQVVVAASTTPVAASVSYALSSGSLALAIVGLPQGASGSVSLTGPGGYHATLTQSQILAGLTPGAYTLAASNTTNGANIYAPVPTQLSVTIQASATPIPATFTYSLASGAIALQVSGLPVGANAAVDVTGPGGFSRQMTASGVLQGLTPAATRWRRHRSLLDLRRTRRRRQRRRWQSRPRLRRPPLE